MIFTENVLFVYIYLSNGSLTPYLPAALSTYDIVVWLNQLCSLHIAVSGGSLGCRPTILADQLARLCVPIHHGLSNC